MARPMALSLLLLAFATAVVRGGLGTTTGEKAGTFDSGNYSVIVAVVADVGEYPRGSGAGPNYHARLRPLATLTRTFDPGTHPALAVDFWCGKPGTAITEAPEKGAAVIAVIRLDAPASDEDPVRRNIIICDICTFMPGGSALAVVRGLDDPKVAETLKNIQAARLQGRPSTRAAAQPAVTQPTK